MPGRYWSISIGALHTGSAHMFCNRLGCEARMMDAISLTHHAFTRLYQNRRWDAGKYKWCGTFHKRRTKSFFEP